MSTTASAVILPFTTQALPVTDYWVVIEWSSTPPAGVSTSWAVSFVGQTNRVGTDGRTMYKSNGVWVTASGVTLNFMVNAAIATIPTPTPTATSTITPPPVSTPTPTPTPPPATGAYAYGTATAGLNTLGLETPDGTLQMGSQFTAEDNIKVQKTTFYITRLSGTQGVAQAKIYSFTDNTVGALITTSTNTVNTATYTAGVATLTEFYFNDLLLEPGSYFSVISIVDQGVFATFQVGRSTTAATTLLRSTGQIQLINKAGTWFNEAGSYNRLRFQVFAEIVLPPTPTPTPTPIPTASPTPPPDIIIDENVFPDTSNKLSIATADSTITTANAALIQPFTANGHYITKVIINANRLGTLPFNGPFYAGIASSTTGTDFDLIALSSPVYFNTISNNVNQLTFAFDGQTFLYDQTQYYLVIAADTAGLSNVDDTPPCLFVVVQDTSDAAVLEVFRGGQISATDPALSMWYIIMGTNDQQPAPTVPPSITPSPNPQDPVPNPVWTWSIDTTPLWQPLLAWDFAGFILGCWTYSLGGSFFYILVLIISIALYIRYQNLTVLIVLWFIVGSLYAALIPLAGPVGISFIIFGFAGLLYKALAEPKT